MKSKILYSMAGICLILMIIFISSFTRKYDENIMRKPNITKNVEVVSNDINAIKEISPKSLKITYQFNNDGKIIGEQEEVPEGMYLVKNRNGYYTAYFEDEVEIGKSYDVEEFGIEYRIVENAQQRLETYEKSVEIIKNLEKEYSFKIMLVITFGLSFAAFGALCDKNKFFS